MPAEAFSIHTVAGWADMDANGHMANVAYINKAVDARMGFFASCGFPVAEFMRLRIGPVVRRDDIEYFREVGLLEELTVTLALGGMAPDGSRFRLINELFRADGQRAARLRSDGGWLDLASRKLIAPPPDLLAAMNSMARVPEFEALPSSLRA